MQSWNDRKERSTFPFALLFWWLGSTAIMSFLPAPLFGVLIPVFCFVFWSPTLSTLHYVRFETHVFPLYFHSIPIIFPFYSHYVPMRSHYIPLRILYVQVRFSLFPVYIYIYIYLIPIIIMIDLIPPFVFVDSGSRCWTLDRARIKVQGLSNSVWSFAKAVAPRVEGLMI